MCIRDRYHILYLILNLQIIAFKMVSEFSLILFIPKSVQLFSCSVLLIVQALPRHFFSTTFKVSSMVSVINSVGPELMAVMVHLSHNFILFIKQFASSFVRCNNLTNILQMSLCTTWGIM